MLFTLLYFFVVSKTLFFLGEGVTQTEPLFVALSAKYSGELTVLELPLSIVEILPGREKCIKLRQNDELIVSINIIKITYSFCYIQRQAYCLIKRSEFLIIF